MRILPFNSPLITSLPRHAYYISAVSSKQDFWLWFHNNYLQLYCRTDYFGAWFDFYVFNPLIYCPNISNYRIPRDFIYNRFDSISDFIIFSLEHDYYVYLTLDEYYLPEANRYQTENFPHANLIYGYNTNKQTFNLAGFLKKGKYSSIEVSFSDFENSYHSVPLDSYDSVMCFKAIDNHWSFDIDMLINLFEDFILSKNTSERCREVGYLRNCLFGLEVYNVLQEYLNKVILKEFKLEIKPFHILYDHKKCISDKLVFLKENLHLDIPENILREYKAIYEVTLLTRNLVIKCALTKDNNILNKVSQNLLFIKKHEQLIFKKLLELLVKEKEKIEEPKRNLRFL